VKGWLEGELRLREHNPPAALSGLLAAYKKAVQVGLDDGHSLRLAHRLT
jgi:hypothetical protein